jgi:simple sugar transport system substrate-binding protein
MKSKSLSFFSQCFHGSFQNIQSVSAQVFSSSARSTFQVAAKSLLAITLVSASATTVLSGCERKQAPTAATEGTAGGTTSAAPGDKSAQKLVVGFSQIGAESAWRSAETTSIQNEAKKRGIELKFSDAQQKQENQIKSLRTFIAQKVSAIILAPVVETGWENVLQEAKAAKIPVILVDRGIKVSDESLYTTLIASDFVEEGRMAARWLVKKTGGKAKIVELQGTPGAAPANDRRAGFAEVLKQNPGMTIIKSQTGEFTRAKGKEVMEAFLKAEGKKINAVYAHNDDMALGAVQAIEEAGLQPGKDIIVISVDGVKPAFEAIVAGKMNATVECNPLLGPAAFDAVQKVTSGGTVEKKIIVKDQVYDSENAKSVIATREY